MTAANVNLDFYADQTDVSLSGLSFTAHKLDFGRTMDHILLVNDHASRSLEYSFDGVSIHGLLKSEESHSFDSRRRRYIYVRAPLSATTSGVDFRIWSWVSA